MGVSSWPSATLKGDTHSIPPQCPNCGGEPAVSCRYGYRSGFYFLSRKTYYQTFSYCSGCAPMMDSWFKWDKWKGRMVIIVMGAAGLGVGVGAPLGEAAMGVGALAASVIALVLFFVLRGRAKGRLTRRSEQAVAWGPAAYYTGPSFMSLSLRHSQVYRAARSEWIQELVRRNPSSVDDAQYAKIVGEPKPPPAETRPFAG